MNGNQTMMMNDYFFFYNGVFSQWWRCWFDVDGLTYNCTEQYMMAEKARLFRDEDMEEKIMLAQHPSLQKKCGRKVANFDLDQWNRVAKDIVYKGNEAKFTQNPKLKKDLMKTGEALLVEASPTDVIWGIGIGLEDERRLDQANWRGTNWLGEVLTQLRNDLRE